MIVPATSVAAKLGTSLGGDFCPRAGPPLLMLVIDVTGKHG